jgi:hypothetical protein
MQLSRKELSQVQDFSRPSFPSATKLSYRIGGITFGLEAEGALLLTPERELAAFLRCEPTGLLGRLTQSAEFHSVVSFWRVVVALCRA